MPTYSSFSIRFPSIPLKPHQISAFRAAVCESAGLQQDIFHNHAGPVGDDTRHHRPALIQYRVDQGCALIWAYGAGAKALEQWLIQAPRELTMGGRNYRLNVIEIRRDEFELDMSEHWQYYRVHDYLALNAENYAYWQSNRRLQDRVVLLEKVLIGHVLGFCQSAGWWLPNNLVLELVDIHDRRKTRYHGVELLAFELSFRCNLLLPPNIALGKAVSHGFGVQWPLPRYEPSPVDVPVSDNAYQYLADLKAGK